MPVIEDHDPRNHKYIKAISVNFPIQFPITLDKGFAQGTKKKKSCLEILIESGKR